MGKGALEGERQMTKMVPALSVQRGASGWPGADGWHGSDLNDLLMYESYIDTSGYALDDLTVFPLGATLQDPGRYISSNAGVPLQVIDMITQVRLDFTTVYAWIAANTMPGMVGTTVDFKQVLWGQYRTMLGQATFQLNQSDFLTASGGLFGSGAPSTAEKLYCYRFVILTGSAENDTLSIPASRFILNAVIASEPDLEFLMRQKRSYELTS